MLFMLACAIVLGLKTYLANETTQAVGDVHHNGEGPGQIMKPVVSSWVPVLFGILTPVCFTLRGVLIRRLSDEKYGLCFDISHASMSVYLSVNVIVLIFAIIYWTRFVFSQYHFWLGIVGSLIDTAALNLFSIAMDRGPMGPASAIASFNAVILVIVDAFKKWQMPSSIEIIGMVLGFIGCLELVIPDKIHRLICFFR